MLFTTQQMEGGRRYNSKVLIGNWNQDVQLDDVRYKDYLNKRQTGNLVVNQIQDKLRAGLRSVGHSFSQDSRLRFGNKLMLLNKQTNGFLASDLSDRIQSPQIGFAVTATNTTNTPVARNVFILTRTSQNDGFPGDFLHFGQPLHLTVHPFFSSSPLYLHSCATSPQSFARFSRHQQVSVQTVKSAQTIWMVEHADPKVRFESLGMPVPANQAIVLKHNSTGQWLAADTISYKNDYGLEFQVCSHSFLNFKKTQQLSSEYAGKLVRDVPSRHQEPQNIWMFCTAADPSQEQQSLPDQSGQSAQSLLSNVRQVLLERGTYGIRGLARVFKNMDNNGNKLLDPQDFKWGLYNYGLYLDNSQIQALMKHFDRNNDGVVNFDEFLTTIKGQMNDARMRMVALAYQKLDKNGDGQVTLDDIARIYDVSRHPDVVQRRKSEQAVFSEFISMWDTQIPDGIVTLQEFARYYEDVSASIDSDQYFEVMMKNAWGIQSN